ncbi:Metal-dependent hydrolase, beta-lactamase superfamily II [Oceanobacillus limi]|uniref:Metal-dependent hydrolase, beta-lactamase superfamily II n=1 Tax=Oceanobacillus limi TaxID=930131 RepID=A0A1I0GLC9_9BACI|nr:MBL fold metallo-hydrolase [Oceanobacillus limi]SET71856.1 Metal-dependent hydrolase, beta-lactamase superfamily II [Oceanobacillus limi]
MRIMKRIIASCVALFLLTGMTSTDQKFDEMSVHFINVGQGDSIFIQTPNGQHILVDGGPPKAGKKIVKYLEEQGIKDIDLMIATHPDKDHIGGLPRVMKDIDTTKIIDSGKLHTTQTYARYLNQIRKEKIPMKIAKENEKIKIDPLIDITILNAYKKGKNNNESSLALKISYDEIDFLLLSDIEKEQEKKLIEKYDVQSEIIKVAHHGSKTSSSLEFLKEVNPQVALLTYSRTNDYGHPVNRVIENLYDINAHIYSTAVFGDIVIRTEGENYYIYPEKSPLDNIKEKVS